MIFQVSYDLKKPDRDYTTLEKQIKSLGSWCHPVESTWFIDTISDNVVYVRDSLLKTMDNSDALIVNAVKANSAAWFGLGDDVIAWIKQHLA